MRYIDADALIEFIENRYDFAWKDGYEGGIKDACTDILGKINEMLTIELLQRTGKWIKHIDDLFPTESTIECNVCHHEQPLTIDDNYCPNCGLKMFNRDGDDDYFFIDDYDKCYECGGYGDDYSLDENGDLVCNCDTCFNNPYRCRDD